MSKKVRFKENSDFGEKEIHNLDSRKKDKKTHQLSDPDSYDRLNASWRFRKLMLNHKWSISKGEWSVWENEILPKLQNFESMTWAEIKSASKSHGDGSLSHNIEIYKLCKEAQNEMRKCNWNYDTIFSLRLSGVKRIFGFMEKGVLDIVWYDENHEICPCIK